MTHIAIWTRLRKPVQWFVTIKAQTSLRIHAVSSATLLSAFWEESSLDLPRAKKMSIMSIFYLACLAEGTGLRLALSETQKTGFLASWLDSSRTNISSATDNNIKTNIMRKLFFKYINGNHIIWLRSTSSNTQVIRNYGPQSRGTAGALIFWLQVSSMTLY